MISATAVSRRRNEFCRTSRSNPRIRKCPQQLGKSALATCRTASWMAMVCMASVLALPLDRVEQIIGIAMDIRVEKCHAHRRRNLGMACLTDGVGSLPALEVRRFQPEHV